MKTSNAKPSEYDLVVLGSGAGGKLIAWTSAQKGQRVVVIERKYVGGSCPNIACLPSKNIIHSAKVASLFFRAMTISETRGFMKALIDTASDRILGFTMFGSGAGDVMAAVQMSMLAGLPYTALRDAVIAHPTMPEGLIPLLLAVPPKTKTAS